LSKLRKHLEQLKVLVESVLLLTHAIMVAGQDGFMPAILANQYADSRVTDVSGSVRSKLLMIRIQS
jgi:hypothetical protein